MRQCFLAAMIAATSSIALGQTQDDLTVIEIRARRLPLREHSSTIIGPEQIRQSRAISSADLLRQEPGVDVDATTGGPASVAIRGGNSGHSLIVIDDLVANDPSNVSRSYDFSLLDTEQIQAMEVLRGPQSLAYGSDALSGVIVVHSRMESLQPGEHDLRLRAGYGSFRTRLANATFTTRPSEAWGLSLNAGARAAEGFPIADARDAKNDGMSLLRGGAELSHTFSPHYTLRLSHTQSQLKQDLAEAAFTDDPDQVVRTLQQRSHAKLTTSSLDKAWTGHIAAVTSHLERANSDQGSDTDQFPFVATYFGDSSRLEARQRYSPAADNVLLFGLDRVSESMHVTSPTLDNQMTQQSDQDLGAFVAAASRPFESLKVEAGVRRDERIDQQGTTTARLGLHVLPHDDQQYGLLCGSGFKAPTLFQRFAPIYGNRELQAEHAKNCELSYEQKLSSSLSTLISVFRTHYENLIVFTTTNHYENVGEALSEGLEATMLSFERQSHRIKVHATWQHSINRRTKAEIPRRPRFKGGSTWHWTLTPEWDLGFELLYVGSRPDRENSADQLSPYALVSTVGGYKIAKGLSANLRINNLMDRRYAEVSGYRSPGRNALATLDWNL